MENIEELKDITTTTMASHFAEQLATAALSAFASLPKTGKPQPHEHTAYAAIAITFPPQSHAATCLGVHNNSNQKSNPLIISLATGTKCLPGSKRAADGSALNDCHAEVLARRAFLRWIYDEIQYAAPRTKAATTAEAVAASPPSLVLSIKNEESSTSSGKWTVELLEGAEIHMFTSHPPCGDAAIGSNGGGAGDAAAQACGGCEGINGGVGRTGAKPLIKRQKVEKNTPQNEQTTTATTTTDWVLPQAHHVESYASAQATGIVRRKPGRGDPTLSVSCSDKIAKWSLLGIQGALLSSVLATPLFLSNLVVGAPVGVVSSSTISNKEEEKDKVENNTRSPVNVVEMTENALKRAFQDRIESLPPPQVQLDTAAVSLAASELDTLGLLAGEVRRVPCGTSITWRAAPSAQWRLKPAKQQWSGCSVGGSSLSNTTTTTMLITEGFSECITGLFGSKAGAARRGADPVPPERQSALCRAALFQRFSQVSRALEISIGDTITYAEAKNEAGSASGYKSRWNEIIKTSPTSSPFEGWIEKPSLGSAFTTLL